MKFKIDEGFLYGFECEDDEKHVVIPEGVTFIGCEDSENHKNIESLVVPDSVTGIGAYAFADCVNLSQIKFSENLRYLSELAFDNTKWLKNQGDFVVINDKLYKYQGNEKDVVIPENIQYISGDAFKKNENVESILMSDNVLKIDRGAFSYCRNLKHIRLSENLSVIEDIFIGCRSLEEISIPNNVKKIQNAFIGCNKLEKINFPDRIIVKGGSLNDTMWYKNYDSDFVIIGDLLYKYKGNQSEIIVPENIRIIGDKAFWDNYHIENVVISENVTHIGEFSFTNCTSLKSVIVPESVKIIGESAFYGCTSLKNVEIFGKPKIMDDAFGKTGLEFDWIIQPEFDEFNLSYDEEKYEYTFSLISENKTETRKFNAVMPGRNEGVTIFRDITTGKYGVKNKIGDIITEAVYDVITPFSDGYAVVANEDEICPGSLYGVITITGDTVIPVEYEFIRPDFPENVAAVRVGNDWGLITLTGRNKNQIFFVSPQFEEVSDYIQGHAAVKKDGKWGLIRVNLGKRY